MQLIRGIHNLRERHRGSVVTIGNYDGVHRGHQHLLAAVREKARALGLPATVVTFEPTPREYFEGEAAPSRLMRLREKVEALPLYGIDRAVILRFDRRMQNISAQEFVDRLLVSGLGTRHLVVGHDFHFARKREGNIETLREQGERHGFSVEEVGRFLVDGERVSSSLVREALGRGDLPRARSLLGRPYRIAGRVRRGQQLGRSIQTARAHGGHRLVHGAPTRGGLPARGCSGGSATNEVLTTACRAGSGRPTDPARRGRPPRGRACRWSA